MRHVRRRCAKCDKVPPVRKVVMQCMSACLFSETPLTLLKVFNRLPDAGLPISCLDRPRSMQVD